METRSSPPTRPRTALEPGARLSSTSFSSSLPGPPFQQQPYPASAYPLSHAHTRSNRESGEVISSLIFSLTPITNQSEQLIERILPAQDIPPQNPSARAKRRAQSNHAPRSAPAGAPPSFFSPLVKEEIVVTDKYRERGDLPTVDEGRPSSNSSSAAIPNRQRLASHPPPIAVPRRSLSLHGTGQATTIMEDQVQDDVPSGGPGEGFGSVSVMSGRATSPSIDSAEAAARKRIMMGGRSPSRAKSTKQKIKELDAERKKRLSAKAVARSPNLSNPGKSANAIRTSPALPRTSNVGDDRSGSAAKSSFLATRSRTSSRTTSALGYSEASDIGEVNQADAGESVGGKHRGRSHVANGSTNRIRSRASTYKHGADGAEEAQPDLPLSEAVSRPSKLREDISRAVVERDEAGTTQRIQELRARKEQRERNDAQELSSLRNSSRPPVSEVQPNGVQTQQIGHADGQESDSELIAIALSNDRPVEQEVYSRKRTPAQEQLLSAKLVSASMAEPRKSSQQNRTYSNLGNYPRPSTDVDAYFVADSIDEEVDEYLSDPRLSQKIYHQDTGRCVSYSDVGDPDGFVIICCVGMGTSRFVTAFYDELAQTLGLRLITPERPGIGDSEPYLPNEVDTPLGWPDDIRLICQHLNISRFSLLAHSAGSIYALATALRMPANIRGRVHVLAPWIPPSQLMAIGHNEEPVPVAELPLIQRILRSIPEAWLEAATRVFNMSSITSSLGKSPYAKRRRNTMPDDEKRPGRGETPAPPRDDDDDEATHSAPVSPTQNNENEPSRSRSRPRAANLKRAESAADVRSTYSGQPYQQPTLELDLDTLTAEERIAEYDRRLTGMIWQLATSNANPAVDLMVCLERKQEIGFRYEDITKPVVLHHGTKDTRVSVDNVIWLGENMRRCEVRVLDGEGHGLMANARVMYSVLSEMAQDWRDWNAVVKGKRGE